LDPQLMRRTDRD